MTRQTSEKRSSWKRRAEARPDEILDAALAEFTEQGFDAARIEDIARRAGLSKGAVYLYFQSKEALLKALIARELTPVVKAALEAGSRIAGVDDIKGAIRAMFAIIATALANPRVFAVPRLIISISGRFPHIAKDYLNAVALPARRTLEALIERGVVEGRFRAVDPVAASRALIGPLIFEALWTHALQGPSGFEDLDHLVTAQTDLFFAALAPET